jgi:hypothetical protein
MNALPKPLTLPCFLESLARPLEAHATRSVFSAQPAVGEKSPRIFLFIVPNIMSIVPEGEGAPLLEFGEQRPGNRSLKAELVFPITGEVTPQAPYERLMFNDTVTSCGFCHAAESPEPAIVGTRAFISQSLRPLQSDQVGVDALRRELKACDTAVTPERCAMLDALLGWGEVTDRAFPEDMATFFGE